MTSRMEFSPGVTRPPAHLVTFFTEVMPEIAGEHHTCEVSKNYKQMFLGAVHERGLTTRKVGGIMYLFDGQTAVGGMAGLVTTAVARSALKICRFKDLTKQMLAIADIPHPAGHVLKRTDVDQGVALVEAAARPQVLKPDVGYGGAGVTLGISTGDDLRAAWTYALNKSKPTVDLVLEDEMEGIDVRVFVINSRAIAATVRVPSHVVGDGGSTVATLFEAKLAKRNRHAVLANFPPTFDEAFLARTGWTPRAVPNDGELVRLSDVSNISRGGDSVDVTDLLHPDLKDMAVRAVQAVPGLNIAGVDLVTPTIDSSDGTVVIELNVRAGLGLHHYPAYGQSRNVAGAMVDHLLALSRG